MHVSRIPDRTETVRSYSILIRDVLRDLDIAEQGTRTVTLTGRGESERLIITFQDVKGELPGV